MVQTSGVQTSGVQTVLLRREKNILQTPQTSKTGITKEKVPVYIQENESWRKSSQNYF